jgi:hypothetical protein
MPSLDQDEIHKRQILEFAALNETGFSQSWQMIVSIGTFAVFDS